MTYGEEKIFEELGKYGRSIKLDKFLAEESHEMYRALKRDTTYFLREAVILAAEGSLEAIGSDMSIKAIQKELVDLIDLPIGGKTWQERYKHHADNFAWDLQTIIKGGMQKGDSYTKIALSVKDKFGKEVKRPMAMARTEGHRVVEATKHETLKILADEEALFKTWHNVGDERVRSSHRQMEGETVPFGDEFILPSGAKTMFPGASGVAEEDINCRCYLEYRVGSME